MGNRRLVLLLGGAAGFAGALVAVWLASSLIGWRQASDREGQVAHGAQLYATYCQTCHGDSRGIGGQPGVPSHGPEGHTWHHSDRNLKETILNGSSGMAQQMEEELAEMRRQLGDELADMMRERMGLQAGAPRMPAWRGTLSDQELDAVLAYIKTFWRPEQRRLQQEMPMMP